MPDSILSIETSAEYPFYLYNGGQTLASGNKGINSSMSLLKISVVGSGAFNYSYRVYSGTIEQENNPDSLLVSIGKSIDKSTSYTQFIGDRYYGETGWHNATLIINALDETTITDIYFGYKKNGSLNFSEDIVLLKDFSFVSDLVTVDGVPSDENYGTVTGSIKTFSINPVTLIATPKENGKFYGWQENGKLLDEKSNELTFVSGSDRTLVAIFGNEEETYLQNSVTGNIYSSLDDALSEARSDETIVLIKDYVMDEDITIPQSVTLYIPYSNEFDLDGNADGTSSDYSEKLADDSKTYRLLTINKNKTLNVNGNLLIGGTIGYPNQQYQGHTSGAHGRIRNNGTILVNDGRIDSYGFIDGEGLVNAISGTIYEPFIVYDFAGGNNSLDLFLADQNPFTQYTMQNISCTLHLTSDAILGSYCNLFASSIFNKTSGVIIGDRIKYGSALLGLDDGSEITRTVDRNKNIKGGTLNNINSEYGGDLGKVTYEITGGAKLGNLSMIVEGFDIAPNKFPIPYGYDFILKNGIYNIPNGWNIMPGARLIVEDDATIFSIM